MGGLEYWPESSPCPSLALSDRKTGKSLKIIRSILVWFVDFYSLRANRVYFCLLFQKPLKHLDNLPRVCLEKLLTH